MASPSSRSSIAGFQDESTIYLGDNARTPYGPRPAEEVRAYTTQAVDWLLANDVKLLVLACNTATARALELVRERSPVPALGVVRPGAVAAAAATRSREVAVIATAGTVESGAYARAIAETDPAINVTELACPELVPMVEAGVVDGRRAESVVRAYLEPLLAQRPGVDTLLLGCTHYPLLRQPIERIVGAPVAVVDSAFTTALAVEDLLDALDARAPAPGSSGRRCAASPRPGMWPRSSRSPSACSAPGCPRSSRSGSNRSGPPFP